MWATYAIDVRVKYLDGNRYSYVFFNGTHFAEIYSMAKKYDVGQALNTFVMELGVPEELAVDGLKDQNTTGTEFMKFFWRNEILLIRKET